jgi:hypothetical protein
MIVVKQLDDKTYEIIEEMKITSLWFSELDTEILKSNIKLATIEVSEDDEAKRVAFNEGLKDHLEKRKKIDFYDRLCVSIEDIVLLKFVANITTDEILEKFRNKLKSW